MSRIGESLDVSEELEREMNEIDNRISQYGKITSAGAEQLVKEVSEEISNEKISNEEKQKSSSKNNFSENKKTEEKKMQIKEKQKIAVKNKNKSHFNEKIKNENKRIEAIAMESKKENNKNVIEENNKADWVGRLLWVAVILIAVYMAFNYFTQPAQANIVAPYVQCAVQNANALVPGAAVFAPETATAKTDSVMGMLLAADNPTARIKALCTDNCDKNKLFIAVSEQTMQKINATPIVACASAGTIIACDNKLVIDAGKSTLNGKRVKSITLADIGLSTTRVQEDAEINESAIIFKTKEGALKAFTLPSSLIHSNAVKLFTRDFIEGMTAVYETENPRVVSWKVE